MNTIKHYTLDEYEEINPQSNAHDDNFADWKFVDKEGEFDIFVQIFEYDKFSKGSTAEEVYLSHGDVAFVLRDVTLCDTIQFVKEELY